MATFGGMVFLGFALVLAAFILISVRASQMYPQLVLKIFKYLIILFFIFAFSVAAVVIGLRIDDRHESSYSKNRKSVEDIWGGGVIQNPPAFFERTVGRRTVVTDDNKKVEEDYYVDNILSMADHKVNVNIQSSIREKGLLKFAGYRAVFKGEYRVKNTYNTGKTFYFNFSLPENAGNISGFTATLNGEKISQDKNLADGLDWKGVLSPGQEMVFKLEYTANGTRVYRYSLGNNKLEIENFSFELITDFGDYMIPERAMVPGTVAADSQKTKLSWQNQKLITGQDIALEFIIPGNYGETAYRLFYYSPLAMALFIMLLLVFSVAKEIKLHPMHYLFLITGFFIFYLLASYLITYVPIIPGIMISVLVSTGIMLYYASMLKKGTVFIQAVAMGSVIFQWIFSIAFFFPAHTGFTITIASILAFIVLMKQTASVEWNSKW